MLNHLFRRKFLSKVLAVTCSIAILLPNAASAATVTTWTDLVSDIAVTGASNTTTLTGNIEADTTASLGAQGATALTITSDSSDARAIVGDGYNTQGITVGAGQTLTLNNIVLNNLKDYAVNNQGTLNLQGSSSIANSNIIDSQATKTGQLIIADGVNLDMVGQTISQSALTNNGNIHITLDNLNIDNDITNNGGLYLNGGTTAETRQTLNNDITGSGTTFFTYNGAESSYIEIAEGKEVSTNIQVYGLGNYYTANVVNNGTISGEVDIRGGGTLTSNLANLTGSAIHNLGTLNLTGGTLNKAITDNNPNPLGTLNIQGEVINGGYNIGQNKINIESEHSFTTNASNLNIGNGIYNAGTLEFTGGTNTATVEGLTIADVLTKGDVKISGDTINNADMDIAGLQHTGAVTLTNNANIVAGNTLYLSTSGLQINGTGTLDIDRISSNTGSTLTQNSITIRGGGNHYGTINGNTTLLYNGHSSNDLYHYGTINGDVTLGYTYPSANLFMKNGSSITGQIINNGGKLVATVDSGSLDITGGITRTEDDNGKFVIGWNASDQGSVNIKSSVEKQDIEVGYYNNPNVPSTLNVTDDDALIDNSTIQINNGSTLNANASKITDTSYLNNGTINFTGGANANAIDGSGTLQISGNVSNSADMHQYGLQVDANKTFTNTGTITIYDNGISGTGNIVNNGAIGLVDDGTLSISNTEPSIQISGTGNLEVNNLYVGTGASITQENISMHGQGENYGTINADVSLFQGYAAAPSQDFYNYGTINGTVYMGDTFESYIFLKPNSAVNGTITNNTDPVTGSSVVITEESSTYNITNDITRTAEGRGDLRIGWNAFDKGTVNLQATLNKQNIIVANNFLANTFNVTDENASITNSAITINNNGTLNANASKITDTAIANNGNLNFVGGENANAISGTGTLNISGTVSNTALIEQNSLVLGEGANFTTYEDIALYDSADIVNTGSLTFNGAEFNIGSASLENNGTLTFDGSSYLYANNLTNDAGKTMTMYNPNSLNLTGTFTNAGTVYMQGNLPENFNVVAQGDNATIGVAGGISSLTIDNSVDLGNNKIDVGSGRTLFFYADTMPYQVANNGTIYLRSANVNNNITGATGIINIDTTNPVNINQSIAGTINVDEGQTINLTGATSAVNNVANAGIINITDGLVNGAITGAGVTNVLANHTINYNNANTVNVGENITANIEENNVTLGNTNINGTLGMTISNIAPDSSVYTGGSLTTPLLTLGENANLSLTVTSDTLLERGQQTGELSLINATYADDRDFAALLANNMYSVEAGSTLGKYIIKMLKDGGDIIEENGGDKNEVATANAWQDVDKASLNEKAQEVFEDLNDLAQHDEKGYIKKIDQVSQQATQAVLAATQSLNNLIGANVAKRLADVAQGRAGGDFFTEKSIWLQALYSHANNSGDGEFSGNTYGASFGVDGKVADNTTLGFGYAYNNTKMDAKSHDLSASGHTLFAYALQEINAWYLKGLLGYGFAKYDDKNSTTSADYNVQNIGVQAIAGYQIDEHWTPEAGLRFTHLMTDNYTDLLGQKVKNDDNDVLTFVLGTKYQTEIKAQNGFVWTPQAHLNLTYDIVSDDGKATIQIGDSTYQINSKKLNAFGIEAGLGTEMAISDRVSLNLGYDFNLKGKFTSHTGSLKGTFRF